MTFYKKLLGVVGTGTLGLGLLVGGANSAQACDNGTYYHQVWVTTYETREVPYTVCVTAYDENNQPYHVYRTRYKSISVPVRNMVTVNYY